jgi:hypothetical protein
MHKRLSIKYLQKRLLQVLQSVVYIPATPLSTNSQLFNNPAKAAAMH